MSEDNSRVSEWNEANFKMKRLHDIQERINAYRSDMKGIYKSKFNYENTFDEINNLYGEGVSKYGETEKTKCKRLKELIRGRLKLFPPHSKISIQSGAGNNNGWVIDEENYDMLLKLLESYEEIVKDFNDKHGLSTKNKGTKGRFG